MVTTRARQIVPSKAKILPTIVRLTDQMRGIGLSTVVAFREIELLKALQCRVKCQEWGFK